MWHDSISRRAVASALALTLLLQLSGCTSWFIQEQPAEQVLAERSYEKLRVTRTNDKRLEVYNPRIVNDTLVGYRSMPVKGKEGEVKPVSLALSDIKRVEVLKSDKGETGVLLMGVVIIGALIVAAVVALENMCMMEPGC